MLEKFVDYLIKRRLKKRHITIDNEMPESQQQYIKVLNTLRENRVMVITRDDGVYIRMAGFENNDECFSFDFVKVVDF